MLTLILYMNEKNNIPGVKVRRRLQRHGVRWSRGGQHAVLHGSSWEEEIPPKTTLCSQPDEPSCICCPINTCPQNTRHTWSAFPRLHVPPGLLGPPSLPHQHLRRRNSWFVR